MEHNFIQFQSALTNLPEPDGNLHLYTLPIGLGESHIIQCPSGQLTIYDFGSGDIYYPSYRFMTADDIREFIGNFNNNTFL